MKERELIEKRGVREKHFLQNDGTIIARVFDEDIHYKKNGKYEEIDNSLIYERGLYHNKNNRFKVYFYDNSINGLMKYELDGNIIEFKLKNCNNSVLKIKNNNKLKTNIEYEEIMPCIDLDYLILPNKIKENLIIKKQIFEFNEIVFQIFTDCELISKNNKIYVTGKNEKSFILDKPFMIDANNNKNDNIVYSLEKKQYGYDMKLQLDLGWINEKSRKYPIIIDPTITTYNSSTGVYDTYIFQGDTNINRNDMDVLKAGVEKVNNQNVINRSLIKFDLPVLGTGSQIINAIMNLTGYYTNVPDFDYDIVDVHRVTSDWLETTANWNNMSTNFDTRVEATFDARRSYLNPDNYLESQPNAADITDLVRKWYTDTPNYGVMLKANKEEYVRDIYPAFFSKNNNVIGGNPKPFLEITYRNQNGVLDSMEYMKQYFDNGCSYVNIYNGNMAAIFKVGFTLSSSFPANIDMVYNTNDVILQNDYGYGLGWKPSIVQTIEKETIDQVEYLKYKGATSSIHYFKKEKSYVDQNGQEVLVQSNDIYYSEDNLDVTIQETTTDFILTDTNHNILKFEKTNGISYLYEIENSLGKTISINYNLNGLLTSIVDGNGSTINVSYQTNQIIFTSPSISYTLNYNNNKLVSIVSSIGTCNISYNNNNVIEYIVSENGKKMTYQYYSKTPYKIKKLVEYGLNNSEGVSYELTYNFSATTIKDNKNRSSIITFNKFGNVVSINNLKEDGNLNGCYGQNYYIGEMFQYKNKLMRNCLPIKYVKNYITDSSFEESNNHGFSSISVPSNNIIISNNPSNVFSGNKCLRIDTSTGGTIVKSLTVSKGKYYTFSAYIKSDVECSMYLSCTGGTDIEITDIKMSTEYKRYSCSIFFPQGNDNLTSGNLNINISFESNNGYIFIDDIQLEEGEVANNYNYLTNSDFSEGLTGWSLTATDKKTGSSLSTSDKFEVISVNNFVNALKIKMNPSYQTSIEKIIPLNGKMGDLYNISFWYKNESTNDIVNYCSNNVILNFQYDENGNGQEAFPSTILNPNNDEWQFFSYDFVAIQDFQSIRLSFFQSCKANNLFITNINLFKDLKSIDFNYDENGNVKTIYGINDSSTNFEYDKNNELISVINPRGKNFTSEYDNIVKNQSINGISANGLSNQLKYDNDGNLTSVKISNYNQNQEITNGLYSLRVKGTSNYVNFEGRDHCIIENDGHSHCLWNFVKIGDYFRINLSILQSLFLTNFNNELKLLSYSGDKSLFILTKNNNNSYFIQSVYDNKYLKISNNTLSFDIKDDNDDSYQFYLEGDGNELFMECDAEYTSNGRFIKKITDCNLNKTDYTFNETSGLVSSITNAKNQITNYSYDNQNRLTQISNGNKSINYTYNSNNLLSKISQGNKEYNLIYDNYLNLDSFKIGNNITLFTNEYEQKNGNLISTTYGNNDSISYQYDDFDRLKKLEKMDNEYYYKYDGNSNLVKIISDNSFEKFNYDLSKRLQEYYYNEFFIKYSYDNNDNITECNYELDNNINNNIIITYDDDDNIISNEFDGNEIEYNYDYLNRITSKTINDTFTTNYEYITNGKRTTILLKSLENGNNKYSYKYDKLNNITHIYFNNNLIKKYKYDSYNEIIEEIDYVNSIITQFTYDSSGNITTKKLYNANDSTLISQKNFEYTNSNWEDQLTKYDNEIITYDAVGNPVTIGSKQLSWINGNELSSYVNGNKTVSYTYNNEGLRICKNVNGSNTYYYLENDKIIYQKNNNNVIYFMYNDIDGLVGFEYNNNVYYYIKNYQKDIIGILDSNNNIVANYTYDVLGNILSITDSNNNDVSSNLTHIANINPFRYRGYYYDIETNLYYLNHRYYNPLWGRFINPENNINSNNDILSCNLYLYVSNNYVNMIDKDGNIAGALALGGSLGLGTLAGAFVVGAIVAAVVVVAVVATVEVSKSIPKTTKKEKKNQKKDNETKNQYVYTLVNTEYKPPKAEYVGRTNDWQRRSQEHQNNPEKKDLKMILLNDGEPMTYYQARYEEQAAIMGLCTLHNGTVGNKIRGLSEKNSKFEEYKKSAEEILPNLYVGTETYVGNCQK